MKFLPFILSSLLLIAACTEQNLDSSDPGPDMQMSSAQETEFNTDITIREIMSSMIDPHADNLWNAVRIVSDSTGITEFAPETDEEWAELRRSAVTMIEGSNSLMMTGRNVAPPGAEGIFPEYEFTPEEVAEKLAADHQTWNGFASGLQDAALGILNAIDARNPDQLTEWGAYLDEACEACHSAYWYRAGI